MAEPISAGAAILIGGLITGGATVYAAQKAAANARKAARQAREDARLMREQSDKEIAQMQASAKQNQLQFETNIAETRRKTQLSIDQANQAQQTALKSIAQQRGASQRAIQQSNLQGRIQQQRQAHNVGRKSRKRVGTPRALRTKVEANSALTMGGGKGGTTKSGTGGLNV